jgi:hypothetical protein
MIFEILLPVVVALFAFTILYRIIPHRQLGAKKPLVAFLPKYQKTVTTDKSDEDIQNQLETYGFKKVGLSNSASKFTRGSVVGDFSIKLAKVNVSVSRNHNTSVTVLVDAAWFVAFDTGDSWTFLNELSEKIES